MAIALTELDQDLWFPHPEQALDEPEGLLAMGGDLSQNRLRLAYRHGIFPWYEDDQPLLWWSPPDRAVVFPDRFKPSRSLARLLSRMSFKSHLMSALMRLLLAASSIACSKAWAPGSPKR